MIQNIRMLYITYQQYILYHKCKYIIHTSGNGELWITLWRGNSKNMLQYLNPKEYIHGVYNEFYNPNKTEFWIKHYE